MPRTFAHTDGAGGCPHGLIDHLRDTATRAHAFATDARPSDPSFSSLASWAGWLHDLGKYRPEFQDYLFARRPGGPDTQHAIFGAARARSAGLPVAVRLAILGHHAGLHDWTDLDPQFNNPALDPLNVSEVLIQQLEHDRQADPTSTALPGPVSEFLSKRRGLQATFDQELSIRMLFSCLVDADYLDTEHHMTGTDRPPRPFQPEPLFNRLDAHVRDLQTKNSSTPVNVSRRALYEACLSKAELPPGGFSLTAPTGSGKTLAMMAFALKHAAAHNLRRVIVVLPFLAIIEQNARVYRDILGTLHDGSPVVLEHHSAVQKEREGKEPESQENETPPQTQAKQATENWDAPVIVTTAVQFLESLFARRPSRCRKLHNIARSVVLFDEVQTLPFPLLDPILSAVRDLRDHFGVSFLFASATQPTFDKSPNLPCGFKPQECQEIDENRRQTFSILRRTRLELPFLTEGKWSWAALAERIKPEPRALIIVNLRKHAQDLYDHLKSQNTPNLFHLSSTMCTAHREAVLGHKDDPKPGTIYHALQNKKPCVVVSTQVVEAGVDVDFPIVFRALAPLDAIIQAAGRCDREGTLTLSAGSPAGRVVVFEPDFKYTTPPGFYTEATTRTRMLLAERAADPDQLLDNPDIFARYHKSLIADGQGRELSQKIQKSRSILNFKTVDSLFRLIDDAGQGVIVRYGDAPAILDRIRARGYVIRDDRRDLQRYSVALMPTWFLKLQSSLEEVIKKQDQGLWEYTPKYDEGVGLRLGELPVETFGVF